VSITPISFHTEGLGTLRKQLTDYLTITGVNKKVSYGYLSQAEAFTLLSDDNGGLDFYFHTDAIFQYRGFRLHYQGEPNKTLAQDRGIIIHKHSTVGTLMWICGPRPRRDSFKMAKFSLTVVRILLADFIGALFYLFSFYLFLF